MTYETIRYEVREGIARLTMNRPEVRNGLNQQMTLELLNAAREAAFDPDARLLLITGAGTAFCSGADLGKVNTDNDPARRAEQGRAALAFLRDAINPLVSAIYHLEKPVIAAVNGPVVGGGIGLALAADIVVATESARFIANFTPKVALIPDLGSTWMLPRLIGRARAMGLAMLGETLGARQAEDWGLIWKCFADGEFAQEVDALAAQLASGPGFAMGALKAALRASADHDYDQQLRTEMELSAQCGASDDFAEAAAAFMAKRPPVFAGRTTEQ